ncbi:hypothetical protein Asp14428_30740 [Actinoplanes sp. NBRC 14428]|uniref:Prepilin-type N-terminal cleavage/methylation domain-containing protein n=1 Tax=Pseudosporangium ferrugineum TaxID=439699 RepID=A0A2T0RS97_9ACTN|nr:type II secretion system protein [Pseudosporangium ferrugineum]PRY24075.1 prepilin-type N-terminal cleavage/methylation domain-containing protein [Pseudosporangium ferrugineum]BCJ51599.1 hypothetical protein Asp14428_30740 [Actinoplanes sp. NBRC 14428]
MRRQSRVPADGGFTMIEVVVALALVTGMMAALGAYFVSSVRASRYQAQIQTAARLAQSGMEAARGLGGPTLLTGRAECGSCTDVGGFDTAGYLSGTVRWDAAAGGIAPAVPLPDVAEPAIVRDVVYHRHFLVGRCWQPAGGGECGPSAGLPVAMVRLVVAVVWDSPDCGSSRCYRAATSLFSADSTDPVFDQ